VQETETIEGRNPVLEALKAGRPINKLLLAKGLNPRLAGEVQNLARQQGIPVQQVDRRKLDALAASRNHQGLIAMAAPRPYVEVEDILAAAATKGEPPLLVLVDELEDPHNLGAIIRTAEGVGVHGLVLTKRRGVGLTAAVARASAGAVEYLPVARVVNLVQTMEFLKKQGLWIVGTDANAPDLYHKRDLTGPLGLVVGGEGKGMGRLVRETCDFTVRLPMVGRISSLNAAVAAGVLLYEITRQRAARAALDR